MTDTKINLYPGPYHWYMSRFQEARYLQAFSYSKKFLTPHSILVDIGGGDGRLSAEIAKKGCSVLAIDAQLRPLQFARILIDAKNMTFCQMDARRLGVKKNSIDVITCFDVIEHLPLNDVKHALREIRAALKQGGLLILTTPNIKELVGRFTGHELNEKHYQEFDLKSLTELLNSEGFSIQETKGIYVPVGRILEKLASIKLLLPVFRKLIAIGERHPEISSTFFIAARKN